MQAVLPPLVGPDVLLQRIGVAYEYPVIFTDNAFGASNNALLDVFRRREPSRRHRVLVVADAGLLAAWPELSTSVPAYFSHHQDHLDLVTSIQLVPGGEAVKNDPELPARMHQLFAAHHLDRHSFVVILGGGGVLDAVGFAAATCHRGLRVVRMPTTVLGQNDSGVGVKNGINAFGAKNFVGTFAPPFAVVNDLALLSRLPLRDRIAGQAEAVKVALIRDHSFFSWLETHAADLAKAEPAPLRHLIRRCAELHMIHIATGGDPFEMGSARPLDYGHWAAHKLETMTAHELRHGEAVAIGLLLDSRYAVEIGMLPVDALNRIHALLRTLGLPCWHPCLDERAQNGRLAVLKGLDDFREHLGGDLTVTLLHDIGHAEEVHALDESRIETAVAWMKSAAEAP